MKSKISTSIRIAAVLILAAVFTVWNVQLSRECGRLSTVSNYDDVSYLNHASRIYYEAKLNGTWQALKALTTDYLHAPFPVLNALLGFAILGHDLDTVYYALLTVVATYLLAISFVCRKLSAGWWIASVLSALAVPFAAFSAVEFRPDLIWATIIGVSGVSWIGEDGVFQKQRNSMWFGAALGVALLVKPSTFAMTLLVFGSCWLLAAHRAYATHLETLSTFARSLITGGSATLLVCGWYWIQHGAQILDYFYANSFGRNRDVWAYGGDLGDRLTYYFQGPALNSNLGLFFVPLIALYAVGSLRDLLVMSGTDRRIRGASFVLMLLGLALINAAFGMKSPYLGGSFYGFCIFGGFFYGSQGLLAIQNSSTPQWFRCLAGAALVGLAWTIHRFPDAGKVNSEAAANQKFANLAALNDLALCAKRGDLVLYTQGNPIVPEFLDIELRARGKPIRWTSGAMERTMKKLEQMIVQADFVFVQDQELIGAPGDKIPGEKFQPELRNFLNAQPDWKILKAYELTGSKKVYLYHRTRGQYASYQAEEGGSPTPEDSAQH